MTHEAMIEQLKQIQKSKISDADTFICQEAVSFVQYLEAFPQVETSGARMLLLKILRDRGVPVTIEIQEQKVAFWDCFKEDAR